MKYLTTIIFAILITSNLNIATLSLKDYTEVKAILKSKVANMATVKLTNVDVSKWIEVVLKEIRGGCKLKNVTGKNIITILNNCLN